MRGKASVRTDGGGSTRLPYRRDGKDNHHIRINE
jgi:hypothetical protein